MSSSEKQSEQSQGRSELKGAVFEGNLENLTDPHLIEKLFAQRAREVRPCPAVLLKRLGSLTGCSPEPHGVYAHRLCIASTNLLFTVEP